jgi:16S rRNA (cytosine967-C5)-methyltransferase
LLDAQEIQMQKKYNEFADRVLLDVPCSGLGVLRRNPDAKWKLNMDFINNMRATQQAILTQYSNMTKVGGKLIYATCSIMPGENENQIATFLQNNPNFELEEQLHTLPSSGEDGFFMARMKRLYQCDL